MYSKMHRPKEINLSLQQNDKIYAKSSYGTATKPNRRTQSLHLDPGIRLRRVRRKSRFQSLDHAGRRERRAVSGMRRSGSSGLSPFRRRGVDAAGEKAFDALGGGLEMESRAESVRRAGTAGRRAGVGKGRRGMPGRWRGQRAAQRARRRTARRVGSAIRGAVRAASP